MSWQHAGHHEINVNTLNQLHEQGEAISPILKDVEKVGRTSGIILTTHLLKPETEQQES